MTDRPRTQRQISNDMTFPRITVDHARAGKRARRRGANGENEVRDLLRQYGWLTAHRNFQSGGQGGGDLADAIPDWHLEVKFTERLDLRRTWRQCAASARPTDTIVIAHRCNFQPWLATLLLTELVELVRFTGGLNFRVIGERQSVRAEMMAFLKEESRDARVLVHPLMGAAVCTTPLLDLLAWKGVARRLAA